jgi:hypothetical protein
MEYTLGLSDLTPPAPPPPPCFNPPPDCRVIPVTCDNPQPTCAGDSFLGYFCDHAANQGFPCGVGDPLLPDVSLCLPRPSGLCNGGNHIGLPCTAPDGELTPECPGTTVVCERAVNEGAYCGVGNPPVPDATLCLQNGFGICSGGPNYGLPCMAGHMQTTPDCPPSVVPPPPTDVTVTLPIPVGTTFVSADNGGTFDGTNVTWVLPPIAGCGAVIDPPPLIPPPPCPVLTVRLTVNPLTPVGTVLQTRAQAVDGDGLLESAPVDTTVGTFGRTRLVLAYPRSGGRDSAVFRTNFTLGPTQTIDPALEAFRLQVLDVNSTVILDRMLAAGDLDALAGSTEVATYRFRTFGTPSMRVVVTGQGLNHYVVSLSLRRTELEALTANDVVVTLTLGDDVLMRNLEMNPGRTGRRFVGVSLN